MKHFYLIFIIIIIASCKKEHEETCSDGIKNQDELQVDCGGSCSPCPIEYPEMGTYGLNLLHGNDTLLVPGTGNSFRANIADGSSLKIEMNLISGDGWVYSQSTNVGWSISIYSNGSQTFDAINGGTTELNISKIWMGSGSGTILIKYFENGTTETKRKLLIWQ
jgi:hypothetical protein